MMAPSLSTIATATPMRSFCSREDTENADFLDEVESFASSLPLKLLVLEDISFSIDLH